MKIEYAVSPFAEALALEDALLAVRPWAVNFLDEQILNRRARLLVLCGLGV